MAANLIKANSDLQMLVHELSKANPDSKLIEKKAETLGIPYSQDIIVLMSDVLVYLSQKSSKPKNRLKEKVL